MLRTKPNHLNGAAKTTTAMGPAREDRSSSHVSLAHALGVNVFTWEAIENLKMDGWSWNTHFLLGPGLFSGDELLVFFGVMEVFRIFIARKDCVDISKLSKPCQIMWCVGIPLLNQQKLEPFVSPIYVHDQIAPSKRPAEIHGFSPISKVPIGVKACDTSVSLIPARPDQHKNRQVMAISSDTVIR